MAKRRHSPISVAAEIRRMLKRDGSTEHATGVQWFFKEEIKSHGWYTAALRRAAVQTRRQLQKEFGLPFVIQVADKLFSGRVLEEKIFAVFLLEKLTDELGEREFQMFESWLDRISSWADHDGLVHYLIAPMVFVNPMRIRAVFEWSKSPDRWHRRAACVALIHGTRQKKFWPDIQRLSGLLLTDEDDMVQKGLGWLLRETGQGKSRPYCSISSDDSRQGSASSVAHCVRNLARSRSRTNSQPAITIAISLWTLPPFSLSCAIAI